MIRTLLGCAILATLLVATIVLRPDQTAEVRLFHFQVHERLRASGVEGEELSDNIGAATAQLQPLVEPAVTYFHRKALVRAIREDVALHLVEDAGLSAADTTGWLTLTVAFVDLARFTAMTEVMGDVAAAEVLDRFSALARRAALSAGGRVVKQIGDEFILVFSDATAAMQASIHIRLAASEEAAFLATRIGLHCGSVLSREGDYVGSTVNLAARVASQAGPHQLLVTGAVWNEISELDDISIRPLGHRRLKGLDARSSSSSSRPYQSRPVE